MRRKVNYCVFQQVYRFKGTVLAASGVFSIDRKTIKKVAFITDKFVNFTNFKKKCVHEQSDIFSTKTCII